MIENQTVRRHPYKYEYLGAHRYDVLNRECQVLLVGEDNPHSAASEHALYPYPEGCAGHRFAEVISGADSALQLATWRTNLCVQRWSAKVARERARELVVSEGVPWRTIVMLGRKVADAFRYVNPTTSLPTFDAPEPFSKVRVIHRLRDDNTIDWITLVALPHPSGRNRVWNDRGMIYRARALLHECASEWYSCD